MRSYSACRGSIIRHCIASYIGCRDIDYDSLSKQMELVAQVFNTLYNATRNNVLILYE